MDIQIKYRLIDGFYFKVSGEVQIQDHEGWPFPTQATIEKVVLCDRHEAGLMADVNTIRPAVLDRVKQIMINKANEVCKTQQSLSQRMEPTPA